MTHPDPTQKPDPTENAAQAEEEHSQSDEGLVGAPVVSQEILDEMVAFGESLERLNAQFAVMMEQEEKRVRAMEEAQAWWFEKEESCEPLGTDELETYFATVHAPKVRLGRHPQKGRVLLATDEIASGELILVEDSLVRAPKTTEDDERREHLGNLMDLWLLVQQTSACTPEEEALLWQMANAHDDKVEKIVATIEALHEAFPSIEARRPHEETARLMGIMQTNVSVISLDGQEHLSLHPYFAMLSHSCNPNAVTENKRGVLFVQARRRIPQGDEVAHSYIDAFQSLYNRQRDLFVNFNFLCVCERCEEEKSWAHQNNPPQEA